MGQHGHRNMYYQTGQPGWVRFGYSPGRGGQPPGAQYLEETGQLQDARNWFRQNSARTQNSAGNSEQAPGAQTAGAQQEPGDSEKELLKKQVAELQQQVQQLQAQVNSSG